MAKGTGIFASLVVLFSAGAPIAAETAPPPGGSPELYLAVTPTEMISRSFWFDDCGESDRGQRFREHLIKAAAFCPRAANGAFPAGEELGATVERIQASWRERPPKAIDGGGLCREKPRAFWGILLDDEDKFAAWDSGALTGEQIAQVICKAPI